ncbi:HNH/endonuclease VII toxin of polymorphic toxin system [Nitrosomonas sp. Nm84]|uniref:PAAR-like domain-containing protein n=1 Tax=Nitrosomonas sp. Nm84 TaxID=200124 RepID=UPI000D75DE44|nr:PAAR-like domain-containing protein [Nitrosomonas sp. Nm84]PXW82681.1 HNH/endonuclease VII toxin of polymorphic toxin system [Nitrosomonas sp. Nm84]
MANEVYANGMELACKAGAGKTICAMPDVCFTPPENPATPPGVPVPYPNTGMASDTTEGSKTVQISGKEIMLKNKSYFKKSTGDEAGAAAKKGVISSKNTGKVYFIKWSMDVKFEGENVDRHLDMTTNNHGSPANEAVPWPFIDAMAMAAVNDHPCNTMGKEIVAKCKGENDYSEGCCTARKCLLAPFDPNSCCNGSNGEQMTPHHVVLKSQFYESGFAGLSSKAAQDAGALLKDDKGKNKYSINKAPCICEEGTSQTEGDHGEIHTETNIATLEHESVKPYLTESGKSIKKDAEWKVGESEAVGAQAVEDVTGCDKDCIEAQVRQGHADMGIDSEDKIRPTVTGRRTRPASGTGQGFGR